MPRLPGLQQGPWCTSRDTAAAAAAISAIENILRGGSREQVAETATREQVAEIAIEALAGVMTGLKLEGEQGRDMGAVE